MNFIVRSAEETEEIGKRLGEALKARGVRRAFIALEGEMGVGKTVFTRGFASELGAVGIKSPTYTIVNEHRGEGGLRIYHFDLYRIESSDDLESIGYYDYVESDGYSVVEWPQRAGEDIPDGVITVTISRIPDDVMARNITVSGIEF